MKKMFITWILLMILMVGGLTFIGWHNIQRHGIYFSLERTMRLAAEEYFEMFNERLTGESVVSKETLIQQELIEGIDEELMRCVGYVLATPRGRSHTFRSYIKCEDYTTRGFDELFLERAW